MKVMWHFAENTIKKGNCGSEITSGSREEYDAPKPDKSKHLIWLFCNKSDRNKESTPMRSEMHNTECLTDGNV